VAFQVWWKKGNKFFSGDFMFPHKTGHFSLLKSYKTANSGDHFPLLKSCETANSQEKVRKGFVDSMILNKGRFQ
jgi:hypothetical protein